MKSNIHTIPADLPFGQTLARWLLEKYGDAPHLLSRVCVLLPSRRAASALREAFLRITEGKPLLLPRMQPLGDVDEDLLLVLPQAAEEGGYDVPTAAFETKRLFLLARLIRERKTATGKSMRMGHALGLAVELARLFDELEREQASLASILHIVPEDLQKHWQITVEFLKILSQHWPALAHEQGIVSTETCRNQRLAALAHSWAVTPPDYPVIAAGSTGSIPATAALLKVVAALPEGHIVLPGLDTEASKEYCAGISENHPQWGMLHLLAALGCSREEVSIIAKAGTCARTTLLSEIMRPAESSEQWQQVTLDAPEALKGLTRIDAAHRQEEATAIALILRQTLEEENKTAALITHDRILARQVVAIMQRFGVTIDDSAGTPLLRTPAAGFMCLVLEVVASGAAAIPFLSLLKHPLARAGMERIACLDAARALEIALLRGVRNQGGIAGLKTALQGKGDISADVVMLLDRLELMLAPLAQLFARGKEIPMRDLLSAHLQCAEDLAGEALWQGADAAQLADVVSEIREACALVQDVPPEDYPAVFETLLEGKVYRPQYGMHARLKILSPIEARMQQFDRIILGGLNEGSWPAQVESEPWFNRSMGKTLGLPAPERKTGLAAHDFFMLAHAPEVILTRAQKMDGVPAIPSRWLVKLDVLLEKYAARAPVYDDRWLHWARDLDASAVLTPALRPAPKPPLAARPRQMSVTKVETWRRNPYAIYASEILCLRALKPLAEDPSAADFGSAVHEALENFVLSYPAALDPQAEDFLRQCGKEAFAGLSAYPAVRALWWPRFTRIAEWVMNQERRRRPAVRKVYPEMEGVLRLENFTLTGRADRIEEHQDNSFTVIDYKTGRLPEPSEIEKGLASQLTLLALMVQEGDMPVRGKVKSFEYWKLKGGLDKGEKEEKRIPPEDKLSGYIAAAKDGLMELIRIYDNPDFPYRATPIPEWTMRYDDYEHLARMQEWS